MTAASFDDEIVATLRAAGCVFAEDEARLLRAQARTPAELALLVRRRVAGEPLEHVLGWAEFAGLRVAVEPGVFVPRHRSEFLVDQAAAAAPGARVVVDLCCGSGAIGAALVQHLGAVELHASELDAVAVRCARRTLAGRGEVHQGDLYAALPVSLQGRIDLLVASTPYVPSDAVRLMPPEAREHEPLVALDGGRDGLDVVRRLVAEAPAWIAPGGVVAVETSVEQAPTAREVLTAAGLEAQAVVDDDAECVAVLGRRTRPSKRSVESVP
jgi:release factor glutamine methyltransferase